jgi:hypothetical protein
LYSGSAFVLAPSDASGHVLTAAQSGTRSSGLLSERKHSSRSFTSFAEVQITPVNMSTAVTMVNGTELHAGALWFIF